MNKGFQLVQKLQYFLNCPQTVQRTVQKLDALGPDAEVNIWDYGLNMTCRSMGVTMFGDFFNDDDNIKNYRMLYEYVSSSVNGNHTM